MWRSAPSCSGAWGDSSDWSRCSDSSSDGIVAPSLERIQARHWALAGVAVVGAAAVGGRTVVGGVVAGAALISLSTVVYAAATRVLLREAGARLAIGLLFVKLAAFLGLGWLLLTSGSEHRPDPIGFVVGLTCFPAAAVWEAMRIRGS